MAPNTFAKVATSLGDEMLMLAGLTGQEALGRPFVFELDLISTEAEVELESVIAQPVTVQIELTEGKYRYINGIVTRFACVGGAGRYTRYSATLRPWFWPLVHTQDSRIFADKTVPDLVKELLRNHGPIEMSLSRSYRKWEYLVQYRESTFNFVSRLMEQEGIYYYFKHEDGKHTMCLCDSYAAHSKADGYDKIPYFPPYPGEQRERDHIDGWRLVQEMQSGTFAMNDYDFTKPKAGLETRLKSPYNQTEFEVFDYPGEYDHIADGERYTRVWLEQVTSEYEVVQGQGNARGLTLGNLFELTGFTRKDQNREYLVTAVTYNLHVGDFESTHRIGNNPTYRCSFNALESGTPYRPERTTRKPQIAGPQTAIVVGSAPQGKPETDEIYTDRYGRVKVRFHWQRPHKNSDDQEDDPNSCMVRVAQVWAGTNWGAMHIPRIGQEVIVEFLEGDPDRPIITGRVYNADNMPPYTLPANKTQSGIKSRSSKGGTAENFNELRFEDKKGEEQVYMQAEKNMDTLVKAAQTLTVGASRTKAIGTDETTTIGANRTETVTANETITIQANRLETVLGTETINVTGMRTEHVAAAELITIDLARTTTIGLADILTVGAGRMVNVGGACATTVGLADVTNVGGMQQLNVSGNQTTKVDGNMARTIDGNDSAKVGGSQKVNVGGDRGAIVGKNDSLKISKKLVIDAGDEITIKTGSASITMKKSGDIVIKGKSIEVKGNSTVAVKASSAITIKAPSVGEN